MTIQYLPFSALSRRMSSATRVFLALLLLLCSGISTEAQAGPPTASFTSPGSLVCQDSCLTFNSTSTGAIDSIRWKMIVSGMTFQLNNTTSILYCITPSVTAGTTFDIRLVVYGGGIADSSSVSITVTEKPHPVITHSGLSLSVAGTYSSYQWYNYSTAIAGATTASYTYVSAGKYSVLVDSGSCHGSSDSVTSTLSVDIDRTREQRFWTSQTSNDELQLNCMQALKEETRIQITDQAGRKVLDKNWAPGTTVQYIPAHTFAGGTYFIQISGNNTRQVLRWTKL